ncbi:MAG: hypothetical protein ABW154_06960 [Dyella sp.]
MTYQEWLRRTAQAMPARGRVLMENLGYAFSSDDAWVSALITTPEGFGKKCIWASFQAFING